MKYLLLLPMIMIGSMEANAFEVKDCQQNYIGLETLVQPVAENSRSYYGNRVHTYKVDHMEPACCSYGVAIVLPNVEDELGGDKCVAITNITNVDVKNARSAYDARRGLLLTFKTRTYNGDGTTDPGPDLKVRVNLQNSKVTIE